VLVATALIADVVDQVADDVPVGQGAGTLQGFVGRPMG
jgi:hypothetical protein